MCDSIAVMVAPIPPCRSPISPNLTVISQGNSALEVAMAALEVAKSSALSDIKMHALSNIVAYLQVPP